LSNRGHADDGGTGVDVSVAGAVPPVHTAYVEATPPARQSRPRTIWLPCVLAFLWSVFLIFADIVVALASNLTDTAPPRQGWVYPAVIGNCVLAVASVLALITGLRFPARRRAAAITAWMIIPVGLGWLVLIPRLLGGS
jgi:hypothetical protein